MNTAPAAARLLAGLTRLITGVRAQWAGAAPTTAQRVYYANHSSHLDTLVIWASLPAPLRARTRPVAAADYWDRPGLRRWLACQVLNALLVERAGGCGSREALRRIDESLAAGDSLILFPEGTRGDGTTVGELKPGLYFVARQRPTVELVPVYLQDLSRILPKGEVLPVPLLGSATFGAPLALAPGEDRHAFLQRARAALIGLGARG
ncbi:MAG: 1-acyl-sn-glycerol-3-phosphate acyltransferase [Lamprocystis purpurea]|uniref:lysophospholipid acyltransferase family protein n=1 Tax=Lamprocystis purpurea TaxID=61598 RepID=UPI00035F31ED|nr:lysophospholipid acyltransferase family protein [Lamprocystis purpurea]MBV5273374.1 1-acyl-sn-glycerol-3-phosphate acyltransferase [Lamprocystis purpurea]